MTSVPPEVLREMLSALDGNARAADQRGIFTTAILTLAPLAKRFLIPLVEKAFGGRKSPNDVQTGKAKQDMVIALLQQLAGALPATSATADALKTMIDEIVKQMNDNDEWPDDLKKRLGTGSMTFTGVLNSPSK